MYILEQFRHFLNGCLEGYVSY